MFVDIFARLLFLHDTSPKPDMPETNGGCSIASNGGTNTPQTPQSPTEFLLDSHSTSMESVKINSPPSTQRSVDAILTQSMSIASSEIKSTANFQTSGSRINTTPLFRQSKISIAIDVSGSTYGHVLESEVSAIRSICSLFPKSLRSAIKIIPWSDVAQRPHSLDELDELLSYGGTNPSAILNDDSLGSSYKTPHSGF